MHLSILTWNIHKGFTSGNRQFVLPRMRELLRELDVDIVMLQEVQGEHEPNSRRIRNWPDTSQFEYLADSMWSHFAYGKNAIADGRHHGNAILSKYPFATWGNTNLSPWSFASRSLLHGDIVLPGSETRIHLVCLHLGLFGFERRRQMQLLNRHLHTNGMETHGTVVGGDFNDWSSRQVSRLLDPSLGMDEAHKHLNARFAATFPARYPRLCMDRLYYRGLEPVSCQSLDTPEWQTLSDHIPLLARFRIT
jgi:endonuclease/exonuclease/phosphatase family metal-dependent hydrolase